MKSTNPRARFDVFMAFDLGVRYTLVFDPFVYKAMVKYLGLYMVELAFSDFAAYLRKHYDKLHEKIVSIKVF